MASERETDGACPHCPGTDGLHWIGCDPTPTPSEAQPMSETRKDAATCAHDWVPMIGGEVCYGCNQIRRYDSVTYTAPEPFRATPTPPEQGLLERLNAAYFAHVGAVGNDRVNELVELVRDAHTALSALARVPAEGVTAEPVAWCPRLADGRLQIEHASASLDEAQEDVQMLNAVPTASTDLPWQPVTVQPLYARATPPAAETPQYATMGELWNDLANELDETRSEDDKARLLAAMHALDPKNPPPAAETGRLNREDVATFLHNVVGQMRAIQRTNEEGGRVAAQVRVLADEVAAWQTALAAPSEGTP